MQRRDFLSTASMLAAGLALPVSGARAETTKTSSNIRIDEPYHGAVLHRRSGGSVIAPVDGPGGKPLALKIRVSGEALEGEIKVNGVAARREGKKFTAEIELREKETEILVARHSGGAAVESASVKVWWLKNSFPRYRFTIDDTVYCFREIHRKRYKSLFDDFFFWNLRKLHRKYGTKFALNVFYEVADANGDFNLSQFSDKYKPEWEANADWLRLLFHAKNEFPGAPYADASPEQLIADIRQVEKEVERFAGPQTYLPPTVIHFAEIVPAAWKPLAELGVTVLCGSFRPTKNGRPYKNGKTYVGYQMDTERGAYLHEHDFLVDFDSGIVFSKFDISANATPLDRIEPRYEQLFQNTDRSEFIDLITHEQYFWPFYKRFIPDHWDRCDLMIKIATEKGHKPVFVNDPFLGLDEV